jgi:predicted metal-binding transcription factor (methanogenesis marker protein 9)
MECVFCPPVEPCYFQDAFALTAHQLNHHPKEYLEINQELKLVPPAKEDTFAFTW